MGEEVDGSEPNSHEFSLTFCLTIILVGIWACLFLIGFE